MDSNSILAIRSSDREFVLCDPSLHRPTHLSHIDLVAILAWNLIDHSFSFLWGYTVVDVDEGVTDSCGGLEG